MTIQENLKKYRKQENLTQEELAERLYVSRQAVSKWERGEAYPDLEKIQELAVMYDISVDELLNGVPYLKNLIILQVHNLKCLRCLSYCVCLFLSY